MKTFIDSKDHKNKRMKNSLVMEGKRKHNKPKKGHNVEMMLPPTAQNYILKAAAVLAAEVHV